MNGQSHTKRFVRAAWALVAFQIVASIGAVAVTGWAAFSVQSMISNAAMQRPAPPAESSPVLFDDAPPTPADPAVPTPVPDASAPAPAVDSFQQCREMRTHSDCAVCMRSTAAATGLEMPSLAECPG